MTKIAGNAPPTLPNEEITPLDAAHADMAADPDNAAARLAFYDRFAEAELFLLLDAAAQGDNVEPRLLSTDGARYVLVFDREARLSAFAGGVAPQAALSGRALVEMLTEADLGVALNAEVAPSAMLIPASAVAWLSDTLGLAPETAQARPVEVRSPGDVPQPLLEALDRKLASARGMAEAAYLVGVVYDDGRQGHLVAFVGAPSQAHEALATGVREALVFSGIEAGALDVTFVAADAAIVARLRKVGLRFDLPIPDRLTPTAPGSDPNVPPKLR